MPAGHFSVHCNCPCWLLYVPAGHGLQSVLDDLCVPMGHLPVEYFEKISNTCWFLETNKVNLNFHFHYNFKHIPAGKNY